jgi:hypothetical protein
MDIAIPFGRAGRRLGAVWRGELPLTTVFWDWAVLGGLAVNLAATIAALALAAADAPAALTVTAFLAPLPYNLLWLIGVWRSAARYPGSPHWARLARVASGMMFVAATAL